LLRSVELSELGGELGGELGAGGELASSCSGSFKLRARSFRAGSLEVVSSGYELSSFGWELPSCGALGEKLLAGDLELSGGEL
jgi:hypothetical protein